MIKTLSPHYITVPLVSPNTGIICNSYTLKLYVWDGLKTAVPTDTFYEITKINAAGSNSIDKIDISRLINDFINFKCNYSLVTSLENGNNQAWVKTEIYYDDQPTIPKFSLVQLATKGYGYFMEGENPQIPINKVLLQGDEFKVNRNGTFVLPILMGEYIPTPEPEINITNYNQTQIDSGSNVNIFYEYLGSTPTEIIIQKSFDVIDVMPFVWVDSETKTPPFDGSFENVLITHPLLDNRAVRLKINIGSIDYFSNYIAIGTQ